jgi:xanthine dehydrogenase accessory factor
MRLWQSIADLLARHGKCAMVTVLNVAGSAPREPGARLLVLEDGSYRGTIGGGALEWRAMAEAQAALARAQSHFSIITVVLGPDLGQCCGGHVKLLSEVFLTSDRNWIEALARKEASGNFSTEAVLDGPKVQRRILDEGTPRACAPLILRGNVLCEHFGESFRPVSIFGAGHVGRALVLALAPLPFEVTWIDSREAAFPAAVPSNVTARLMPVPPAALASASRESFILVMTHSHALDFDIVLAALTAEAFPYVGLIGSETKRARFLSLLRRAGVAEKPLTNFVCPIGIAGIRSKHPAVIAAATAAELIIRDEQLRTASRPLSPALRTA